MAGQSDTLQQQDTLNRYLLYFPRSKTVSPDVHSFCGEEELSKPYRYTIRFTSPNPNVAVKDVLNQMAEFILRAPDPKAKSTWHNQESWLPVRQINGVITSFSRLKSSADEALYECMLEHELALLDQNYRSAVYMDMTVPELVTKLMKESGHFQGYNIDFDQLSHNYPSREMIIQWKETDLQFIRRLLAEVGIWFRFENHDKVQGETVVIFGDSGRRYVFSNKQLPYVRHSGMTSHEEYVTELEEQYQLIPENVRVRTYNYRDPFSPQEDKTITVPGRVAAINRDPTYSGVDAQGRYRVKFDFDLDEKRDGFESALMRLGRPYGGDVFGFHFPLLDGTEVAVAFEGGDPDRPYIAHVMHDGSHPDLVTNRNDTRNVIRTAASNKIRLEDRRGQEHIKISTEHGKGQVSVGHLVDAEGKKRGEGVEARTDDWMALRAAKGVLLTTEAQPRAAGKQLDMTAAIAQLEKALSLAMTLQQSAATAGAGNVETDRQNQLSQMLNNLTGAGLLTYAEKGQAHVTPDSLQLSAGKDLIATAGSDASVNVVKKFSLAVGEKLSLFARKLGIQMIAGAGDITTQAQLGEMHLLSQKDFTMASTAGKMNGSAKEGMQFVCGGGGMLGPGAGGVGVAAAGFASLHMNDGDYTHPIYENPHRIYQFFAAQRLADLIIQIRQQQETRDDVVNIVAHSQGTIITMLANILVKQAGYDPVNCVILNHSPYSLESRVVENIQPGYQQTDAARQKTFKNFCSLMHTQWKGGGILDEDELLALEASCTLRKPSDNPLRADDRYGRNNNGKVYNYFCPNDGVVSLENVQGFGWRGIPQKIADGIPNLFQRVFYQHGEVGKAPDTKPFELPQRKEGDAKYSFLPNVSYRAHDVVVNGEELPEPFIFKLQGQDNHPDNDSKTSDKPYTYYIDPNSPDAYISYSAKASAIKRTDSAMYMLNSYQRISWKPGHVLTPDELKVESHDREHTVIHGEVTGLSRTEKYPLLEVLDQYKVVPDRLELEASLGEGSAGYQWLMLTLAADAVIYGQGDQLVAVSEQNHFAMAALSSRLTCQPDYPEEKRYTLPWEVGGIGGLMFFFGLMLSIASAGDDGKMLSGWFITIMAVLVIGLFIGMGALFTWYYGDKAYEHMGM